MSNNLEIRRTIHIHASKAAVWDALTKPELTKQYFFNCELLTDFKIGSPVVFTETKEGDKIDHVKGKMLAITPGTMLKFSVWSKESGLPDEDENHLHVTFSLAEDGEQTTLTVVQNHYCDGDKRFNNTDHGWDYVLNGLQQLLEKQSNA